VLRHDYYSSGPEQPRLILVIIVTKKGLAATASSRSSAHSSGAFERARPGKR
jgi:hypothetical protein